MRLYLVTTVHRDDGEIDRAWFGSRSQAEAAAKRVEEGERHLFIDIEQVVISKSKDAVLELLNCYT